MKDRSLDDAIKEFFSDDPEFAADYLKALTKNGEQEIYSLLAAKYVTA